MNANSRLTWRTLALVIAVAFAFISPPAKHALGQFEERKTATLNKVKQLSPREVYVKTLNSIAYITTDRGYGTGWVWDVDRRLVVTNDHVVKGVKFVEAYFPVHKDGVLQVEPEFYEEQAKPIKGKVIDSSEAQDLALIQLESLPDTVGPLKLADRSAAPGERVHAIGGLPRGSEGMWKYSTGYVSQVAKADISMTGNEVMALQSNIDINSGNSGGPLVNDEGRLVGVAQSYRTDARDVSYSVDVSTVRDYVNEVCPLVDSDTVDAKVALGQRHRMRGRYDAALRSFSEAIAKDKDSVEGHTGRGWVLLNKGDYVTAIADFSAALKIDSSDMEAWKGRAIAHRELGELDKSIEDISQAIMNDTSNADLYNLRAITQERREEYKLALGDYRRALELSPNSAVIIGNRADLYMNLEQYQDALNDLTKALELAPGSAWLNHMAGLANYRLQQYAAAEPLLSKAVQINDENAVYLADWGENVQAVENHDLGIKIWGRVIELVPESHYAFYSRAWSLARVARRREALRDLNQAIRLAGDDAPAYYYNERGDVLEQLGESEQAQEDYDAAARIDPENYGSGSGGGNVIDSPVVGRWYVNQPVSGGRLEMTHEYRADGTYEGAWDYTENGETTRTEERGNYQVLDDVIRFDTNQGQYDQRYRIKDGKFWLFWSDLNAWVGSVRR